MKNGKLIDEWFPLINEPKKTKDKNPNRPNAEIHLKLHYPIAASETTTSVTEKKTVSNNGRTEGKIVDKYSIGKELGR